MGRQGKGFWRTERSIPRRNAQRPVLQGIRLVPTGFLCGFAQNIKAIGME